MDNPTTLEKPSNEFDAAHKINHADQAVSTAISNAGASSTMLRRSKSCQKIKTDNQVTHETEKDNRSRSFLNLIWRLLLLDWIGNIFKWLWGTSKHDT